VGLGDAIYGDVYSPIRQITAVKPTMDRKQTDLTITKEKTQPSENHLTLQQQ